MYSLFIGTVLVICGILEMFLVKNIWGSQIISTAVGIILILSGNIIQLLSIIKTKRSSEKRLPEMTQKIREMRDETANCWIEEKLNSSEGIISALITTHFNVCLVNEMDRMIEWREWVVRLIAILTGGILVIWLASIGLFWLLAAIIGLAWIGAGFYVSTYFATLNKAMLEKADKKARKKSEEYIKTFKLVLPDPKNEAPAEA